MTVQGMAGWWLVLAVAGLRAIAESPRGALPLNVPSSHRVHELKAERTWLIDLPAGQRFDASGLLKLADGTLLTVNDKGGALYRLRVDSRGGALVPEAFAGDGNPAGGNVGSAPWPGDIEGLARDESGVFYLCEESKRRVIRWKAGEQAVPMSIDWSPVARSFSRTDLNASFEGIAVGGGRLYVANERSVGRIVVVDLATLRVVDDFQVSPAGVAARDVQYSDLAWWKGELWVLCRQSRCVLRVEPASHRVEAEYRYREIEQAREWAYAVPLPIGFAEGLAVDDDHLWICIDNNGYPRVAEATDRRPFLFRCVRPDARLAVPP